MMMLVTNLFGFRTIRLNHNIVKQQNQMNMSSIYSLVVESGVVQRKMVKMGSKKFYTTCTRKGESP